MSSVSKLPGVLSFQRGMIVTDAIFWNAYTESARDSDTVKVVRHGIRGTQNVNTGEKNTEKDVANIQVTETAKTDINASGVKVTFDVRFLPLSVVLFSCAGQNNEEIRAAIHSFIAKAEISEGLQEVARRYARNILNGRWLWRNRLLGEGIQINVKTKKKQLVADALQIPLHQFEDYKDAEKELGQVIARSLAGLESEAVAVEAIINFGFKGAVEVFPSQNYVENKPKGFARPLYKLGKPVAVRAGSDDLLGFSDIRSMGIAALRDQKITNALRTIDTWYPSFDGQKKPIPIEPHGANLDAMKFFRRDGKDQKQSAFDLMRRIGELDPASPEGMYMIASLIRGGVFSESDKKEKEAKADAA